VGVTSAVPAELLPVRACVFALAGRQLAVDIRHTREVVVLPDRTRVPGAPPHILGVANLRGHVVPIVDMAHVLGLPGRPSTETDRTVVLDGAGVQVAVPTDEVLGLETFDEILSPAEEPHRPLEALAIGRVRRADGFATLIDVSRLVAAVRVGPPSRSDA
jgi:chemotaxis signal transduction protein